MSEENPKRAPSSEEVSRALRRCWQPVARVQDLERGPQRAVLLGEALAVFLTEGGDAGGGRRPLRAPRRLALDGRGQGRGRSVPLPRLGVGRPRRRLHADSLAGRPGSDPAARPDPGLSGAGAVGPGLDGAGGAARRAAERALVRSRTSGGGATGRRSSCRSGLGVMIENFRDVAHFAFVHRATLGAVPEVIEPLAVERDGLEVTMRREMGVGDGGDGTWDSLREGHNHVIAPNFTSIRMLMAKGERWLLHAARAISATESVHYWVEGLSEDFDELTPRGGDRVRGAPLRRGPQWSSAAIEPPELSLDPGCRRQAPWPTASRSPTERRSAEFVRRALPARRSVQLEGELSGVGAVDQAGELERALPLRSLRPAELDEAPHQGRIAGRGANLGRRPLAEEGVLDRDGVPGEVEPAGLGRRRRRLQAPRQREAARGRGRSRSRSRRGRPMARRCRRPRSRGRSACAICLDLEEVRRRCDRAGACAR